jgi:hypothetical protein
MGFGILQEDARFKTQDTRLGQVKWVAVIGRLMTLLEILKMGWWSIHTMTPSHGRNSWEHGMNIPYNSSISSL